MSEGFTTEDSPIAEFEAEPVEVRSKRTPKPSKHVLKIRQQYIEAGLIEDLPLPPEILDALREDESTSDDSDSTNQ